MDIKENVLKTLKPKVSAFGFNKIELESFAEAISKNLTFAEDTTEEEQLQQIEKSVENALPFFKLAQSQSSRVINEFKEKMSKKNDDDKDDNDKDDDDKRKLKQDKKDEKGGNEELKKLQEMVKTLTQTVSVMQQNKITDTRKGRLEAILKDCGVFGTRTMKNFSKMKFEDDDEFESFLYEVKADLKEFNSERSKAGLATLGNPPSISQQKKEEQEVYSDAEIEAIANGHL